MSSQAFLVTQVTRVIFFYGLASGVVHRPLTLLKNYLANLYQTWYVSSMVAYFCHHLSDNYVDLSDNYVDLSDLYVDLSDLYVDLSLIPSVEK